MNVCFAGKAPPSSPGEKRFSGRGNRLGRPSLPQTAFPCS